MFAEVAAYAASRAMNVSALLDEIYSEIGYFLEVNKSKIFEGAEGAAKIAEARRLLRRQSAEGSATAPPSCACATSART